MLLSLQLQDLPIGMSHFTKSKLIVKASHVQVLIPELCDKADGAVGLQEGEQQSRAKGYSPL